MEQKKSIKISLLTFTTIIIALTIIAVACFVFFNKPNYNNDDDNLILNYGDYEIDGIPVDPSYGTGISHIILKNDKTFSLGLVYGGEYTGSYSIENNTLTCNANTKIIYEGGTTSHTSNTIFQFNIISNSQIEFWCVMNNYESFGLCLGSTYSIK